MVLRPPGRRGRSICCQERDCLRPPWPLPVMAKNAGVDGLGRHDAGGVRQRLRVNSFVETNGQVLRLVIDGPGRKCSRVPPGKSACLPAQSAIHVADREHVKSVVVIRGVRARHEHPGQ